MNRFTLGLPALLSFLSCAATPNPSTEALASGAAPLVQPAGASSPRPSRKEMVRRILPHNVRISISENGKALRTASGVVIGDEHTEEGRVSYVVTNAHAVEMGDLKSPRLVVIVDDRGEATEYQARPVALGAVPEMDLALLRVPGLPLVPARLAEDLELELGEDVVVAACPFGKSLSLSGGMLSQVEWDRESRLPKMVKTDAPIGYGASGGGVFSLETGKLLAIVEGYRTAKVGFAVEDKDYSFDVPMPGETFAAPTSKVRRFLESKGFARLLTRTPEGGSGQTAQR
jgi:serine protease Do